MSPLRTPRALGILFFFERVARDFQSFLDKGKVAHTPDRELDEPTARGVDEVLADKTLGLEEIARVLVASGEGKAKAASFAELVLSYIDLERKQTPVRVGLIDVPPYVVSGDRPLHHRTPRRAFHLRTWEVPTPIAFPREVFADALDVHARLLAEHGADLLDAPVIEGEPEYFEPDHIGFACALLVSDGATAQIYKWRRQEVSWVVQRCRGIVLQLAEDTDFDRMYVVVVAAGAASVHLVRAHGPRRVGERVRLEVVRPALVVEPWEQQHRRGGGAIVTTWQTPAGDAVASRVALASSPWTVRAIVEALVRRYEPSLRRGLASLAESEPESVPAAMLDTGLEGESLEFMDRGELEIWVEGFPELLREARKRRSGFIPVLVDATAWGAVAWLSGGQGDVAAPPTTYEWNKEEGPCPGKSVAELVAVSHRGPPILDEQLFGPAESEDRPEVMREKLAKSLASLASLVDLDAPVNILDAQRKVARERIAKLDPSDAQAVLRAWPRAAKLLDAEPSKGAKRDDKKPN